HLHADGVVAAAQLLAQLLVACDRFRGRGIVSRLGSGGGATGAEEERHGHGQEGNSRTHASPGFLLLGASITKSAPGCRERLRRTRRILPAHAAAAAAARRRLVGGDVHAKRATAKVVAVQLERLLGGLLLREGDEG